MAETSDLLGGEGSRAGIERGNGVRNLVDIGDKVPDFKLFDVDGKERQLSDFRGSKVLLCFYEYTQCPLCSYAVGNLIGNYKKLAWASKLKVITVFRSRPDLIKIGLTEDAAFIPRLSNKDCYPFLALSDPEGSAASTFQIKHMSVAKRGRHIIGNSLLQKLAKYHKTWNIAPMGYFREIGASFFKNHYAKRKFLRPTEILIDEPGIIVDRFVAIDLMDQINMDNVSHFLLFGKKKPDEGRTT